LTFLLKFDIFLRLTMDKNFFIKLTTNLYRLTLLFPKKEPLRYKTRALADDILSNCVLVFADNQEQSKSLLFEVNEKLEILDSYLELAKSQNWVSPFDILEIQKEYNKIREEMGQFLVLKEETKKIPIFEDGIAIGTKTLPSSEAVLEERKTAREVRQEKILRFLKEKGKAQVSEIKEILPNVSKRTLRRDFDSLVKEGIVERTGEKNNTFYQLPSEAGDETESQQAKSRT
jgi:Fic family protein